MELLELEVSSIHAYERIWAVNLPSHLLIDKVTIMPMTKWAIPFWLAQPTYCTTSRVDEDEAGDRPPVGRIESH